MGLFSNDMGNPKERVHKGLIGSFSVDNIRWEPEQGEEVQYIAVKWPYEDFPNGSILTVAPSQVAVFINNLNRGSSMDSSVQDGGQPQVAVLPTGNYTLTTGDSRFAPFRNLSHKLTDGKSAYHSTVYFINLIYMTDLSWGTTSPVNITDPELDQLLHVRANGMFGAHMESLDQGMAQVQVQKFIRKLVGTRAVYERQDFINDMRREILGHVPELLAHYMDQKQIGYLHIKNYMSELSALTKERLVGVFEEFGVTLDAFTFQDISVPESDLEAYRQRQILKKEAEGNAIKMDIESRALAEANARLGITELQKRQADILQTAAANEGQVGGFMGAGMGIGMGVGMGGVMGGGMRNVADSFFQDAAQSQAQMNRRAEGNGSEMSAGMAPGDPPGAPAGAVGGAPLGSAGGTAGDSAKVCPKCHTQTEAGAKFCMECGYKFEAPGQICPACGKRIPLGAKFCTYCGHKMVTACPACGKTIAPGAKFCPECGHKLG